MIYFRVNQFLVWGSSQTQKSCKTSNCPVLESSMANLVTEPSMANWAADQNIINLAPQPIMVNQA